jgi:hypothetical protein
MHTPVERLVPQNWHVPELVAQVEQGAPSELQAAASLVALQDSWFFQSTLGAAQAAGSYCDELDTHVPGDEGEAAQKKQLVPVTQPPQPEAERLAHEAPCASTAETSAAKRKLAKIMLSSKITTDRTLRGKGRVPVCTVAAS